VPLSLPCHEKRSDIAIAGRDVLLRGDAEIGLHVGPIDIAVTDGCV
jgi:hypothetical protein